MSSGYPAGLVYCLKDYKSLAYVAGERPFLLIPLRFFEVPYGGIYQKQNLGNLRLNGRRSSAFSVGRESL